MHANTLLPALLSLALILTLPLLASSTSTITAPPRPLLARQTSSPSSSGFDANVAACSSYTSLSGSCAAATSSFTALPFATEASCLCYTDVSTYAPSIYDGYWGSCLNYYQTASPEYYSQSLSGDSLTRTPCAAAGNVRGASAATGVVSVVVPTSTGTATATATTSGAASSTATGSSGAAGRAERGGGVLVFVGLAVLFATL